VSWVAGEKPIENTDIVTYLTVGVNHIPRPEVRTPPFFSHHLLITLVASLGLPCDAYRVIFGHVQAR
jgi:hypothetical protein